MLISKLSPTYPMASAEGRVIFSNPKQAGIDPIFLGRLAALAKAHNLTIEITANGGARLLEDQVRAYINSGGHQNKDGTWTGGDGLAAKPGTSLHEKKLAVDTASKWLKETNKVEATAMQTCLIAFGLFKPLTIGNKKTVLEDWHIQPIETAGLTFAQAKLLEPVFKDIALKDFQKQNGLVPDGIYLAKTHAKARAVFKV